MSLIRSSLFRISSADKDIKRSNHNGDFVVSLKNTNIAQSALKMQLKSISLSNNFYNIRSSQGVVNNVLWLSITDLVPTTTYKQYTLPEGQYDIKTFMTDLKSAITADPLPGVTVSQISQNSLTQKIEFKVNTTIGFRFDIIEDDGVHVSSMASAIGFNNTISTTIAAVPETIPVTYIPELNGYNQVYVHSSVGTPQSTLTGVGQFSIVSEVELSNTQFGQYIYHQEQDSTISELNYPAIKNIKEFTIKIRDIKGNILNPGTSEVTVILKVYF